MGLCIAVAIGVALSIALGAFRIVGWHIACLLYDGRLSFGDCANHAVLPLIVPLAYDSGGVTTSTVTVPPVTALGLGLCQYGSGRSALIDGFDGLPLQACFQ